MGLKNARARECSITSVEVRIGVTYLSRLVGREKVCTVNTVLWEGGGVGVK